MLLKIQDLMNATLLISQMIREHRAMPQRGKLRLARMHEKLLPEFNTINASRDAVIASYQCPDDAKPGEWMVPADKIDEFNASWLAVASEEIFIDVEPLVMADIDLGPHADGSIEAGELLILGALFAE